MDTEHGDSVPVERRRKARISMPFAASVSGVDESGQDFKIDSTLENISTVGLYTKLDRTVREGTKLHVIIRLSTADADEPAATLAVEGQVVRTDPQPDGMCGVGMAFDRYGFVDLDDQQG